MVEYIDRRGTRAYKWDGLEVNFGTGDLLPLWVADMDFKVPSCVTDALHRYIDAPLGYYRTPASYFDAFLNWEKTYHGYEIKKEWLLYSPTVVASLHWAVACYTRPGDGVIVLTPVYYPFMNAVRNNPGRTLVQCDLVTRGGRYEIDFAAFEQSIVENRVTLFILCNPHNPIGRVWTEEELRQLMEICKRHHVVVVSDEIHQEFVNPKLGRKKVTTATVGDYDDIIVTMTSPGKTFNLAATQNAFVIIPNPVLRGRMETYQRSIAINDGNGFGYVAVEAAYAHGRPWVDELLETIYGNYEYVKTRFAKEAPKVEITDLEGTYLLWMNFGAYFTDTATLSRFMEEKCKVALDYGEWFGGKQFASFARMNLATSLDNVKQACDNIIAALSAL